MLEYNNELPHNDEIDKHETLTYDILDGMVDWVRVMDKEGKIIFMNHSMKKALGGSFIGTECHKIFNKSERCVRCIADATISTGESVEKLELKHELEFEKNKSIWQKLFKKERD